MRTLSTRSKIVVGATVAALAVGGSTAAYAFFTTTGSGTGSSATTTGVNGALTFAGSPSAALYPGDSPAPINGTVTNSNSSNQHAYVTSVRAYLTVVKASGAPTGTCDATDYLLAGSSTAASPATQVAATFTPTDIADNASAPFTIALKFNNKATNQDGCKGATVTINYSAV